MDWISRIVVLVVALGPAAARGADASLSKEDLTFFESKVRPVLVSRCYKCHSVEERKIKGGLTLDSRDGWKKGGAHGPVIVPGDPAASKLIRAIRYEDPELQMPPDGGKLSDAEIAVLERWIKMGAPDPRVAPPDAASKLTGMNDEARAHWAFKSVKEPAVPQAADAAWVKTPIDAFVLEKLHKHGLKPSSPAAKETLIRRATYDLTGLPPTPQEVSDFVNDASPDAFARVVDRLLASPHYGERWGRYWLDTVRYSDTTGADDQKGEYRYPFAWTYRDYVIASFNADKPYDQFVKEQIAADLLPESKQDPARLAALGFITVGKRFANPNDTIDERIDTLTKTTLALTVSCARCHDHKFDPIPTADYYSLHGVFASITEPTINPMIVPEPTTAEYQDFKTRLTALESEARERYFDLLKEKAAAFRKQASSYLMLAVARNGKDAEAQKLRIKLISGEKLDKDIYGSMRRARGNNRADAVFAPLAAFARLPKDAFAAGVAGVIEEILNPPPPKNPRKAPPRLNRLVAEAFRNVAPESLKSMSDVTDVYGKLFASIDAQADAYVEACRKATTPEIPGFDPDLVELITVLSPVEPAATLTGERLRELAANLPVQQGAGYQRLQLDGINQLLLTHPASPARAMVVQDSEKPRDSFVLIRGDRAMRGPLVPRQFLEVLSGPNRKPFTQGSGRLELAEAIASKDNPLTARVMINRIWMHHFGQGFVRTPDDLGVQSEPPSHPELLDYLASRFAADGWSIKRTHRLIMLSSTYQQSSDTNPLFARRDPENRYLWRANLRRLDFEAVRDSMLAFTGKLDRALGGKPVNLTDEPYSNRRSVYGYIDRGNVPELMSQFDFADPDMPNSRRTTTIVPQQALFFMNSPMTVDVARKVTSRPEFLKAPDDAGRVTALYEVLFQRPPREEEIEAAEAFLQSSGSPPAAEEVVAAEVPSTPLTKAQRRAAQREERLKAAQLARKQKMLERAAQVKGIRRPIRNTGEVVERKPLTVWEQYAQALLFTNEIAYVN